MEETKPKNINPKRRDLKEERMQAGPGTKDYGALSLAVQYRADTYIAANVPPNCFMPRPNVGSCVIRLTKKDIPPVEVKSPELMFKLIRAAFNQRRKTLGMNWRLFKPPFLFIGNTYRIEHHTASEGLEMAHSEGFRGSMGS